MNSEHYKLLIKSVAEFNEWRAKSGITPDLYRADLEGANLEGAYLLGYGTNDYIKFAQFEKWSVGYSAEYLQIGCEHHKIDYWMSFSDAYISDMDENALDWWAKYKPLIVMMIELCPAKPALNQTGADE